MRKSKRGTALFDLLADDEDQSKGAGQVPDRGGPGGQSCGMTREAQRSPAAVGGPVAAEPSDGPGNGMQLDGDRLRVSFTSLTGALALFATCIVVFGAFEFGRWKGDHAGFARGHKAGRESYAAEAISEIEVARNQPPAADVVRGLLTDAAMSAVANEPGAVGPAGDVGGTKWIRDHTYIVAQEFSAGYEDDVILAHDFLARRGVETALVRLPRGTTQLITTQGYNRRDPAQRRMADHLLEKIHALGAEYYSGGGGYKLEGYFKLLTGDTW